MSTLLIKNIGTLVQVNRGADSPVKGAAMKELPVLQNAWLLIHDERIADFGTMDTCPDFADKVINAREKMVFPCWCDPHTHLVFHGSRESEFVDRIKGLTYEEIARRGGGILNSARRLNEASEAELLEQAYLRLGEIKDYGTGAVEIKSGYGLTVEGEIKMLRVIRKLQNITPLEIKATFLGAHAIPEEFKNDRQGYIRLIIEEMLPQIAGEKLADYIDVFCDRGFFTPEETAIILEAGAKYGLKPKIHANELDYSGGVQVGVQHQAVSVDHLECVGEEELVALLNAKTIPTLLPSTAFFLNLKYPPARKMIDAGLPVALASDYNPGSSPSGRMSFVVSLACIKMGMLPEEAINAATINAAFAMEVQHLTGSIDRGKLANVFITRKIPSVAYLPYAFGSHLIETVIIKGQIQ